MNNFLNRFRRNRPTLAPCLFHVTHAKAGSSWLYKIFKTAYGDQVPKRVGDAIDTLNFEPESIYSALFCTHEQLTAIPFFKDQPHFFVMRDIRDTLVSLYFSHRYSHVSNPQVDKARARLSQMTDAEGILYTFKNRAKKIKSIQTSWVRSSSPVFKYEELFESKGSMLLDILAEIKYPHDADKLKLAIEKSSFENSFGRKPGETDIYSHGRNGKHGNWQEHRTDELDAVIDELLLDHLKLTGYEL